MSTMSRNTTLGLAGAIIGAVALGRLLPGFLDRIGGLRAAIVFPLLAIALGAAAIFGRISLVYLLAFVWFIPITTAGLNWIPITVGTTVWELLLWVAVLAAVAMGDIPLSRSWHESGTRRGAHAPGIWIGLGLVTIASLLIIGRVSRLGYGEFRFAAINLLLLLVLTVHLVNDEQKLRRLAVWFLFGALGLLIYQIGSGGYEFANGRLTVHLVGLAGGETLALPNKLSLLAASCAPIALCLALGGRVRRLQLSGLVVYVALLVVVFLTFSRGPMIAVVVASITVLLLGYRSSRGTTLAVVLVASLMVAGIIAWLWPVILRSTPIEGVSAITYRLESFLSLFRGDETLAGRYRLIRLSFDLLAREPFGFGYGKMAEMTGQWEHNLFMAVMNGSGVLGLAGLLLFFLAYIVAAARSVNTSSGFVRWMCIAALGSIITMGLVGLTIELIYPTYPESTFMAVAIGLAAVNLARPGQVPANATHG